MTDFATPVRILYLDHAPILGGAEIVLLNLLGELDRARFVPLVGTAGDSPLWPRLAAAGVESIALPFARLNGAGLAMPVHLLRAALAVASIVRGRQVALIHTNTVRAHIVGSLAGALVRVPVVWTLHDNTLPLSLARRLGKVPRRVITVSTWLSEWYAGAGLASKLVVIPNGIQPAPPAVAPRLRAELQIPEDAPLVVDVGRLVAGKAPHLFVEAAGIVTRSIPNAIFVLVGAVDRREQGQAPSAYMSELDKAVRTSGLGKRLLLVGHRSDVDRFYAAAEVVAYCAVLPEGLPTVLLETMRHSKPVVASEIGGAREIVQEGISGLLVPPGNVERYAQAIVQLLQDRERARRMGAAGHARLARDFSLPVQVARTQQIYEDCLS